MPGRCQRRRLGLSVADDAGHDEVRIVESRSIGVDERVAQFSSLVDRARGPRRHVAGDAAREGELTEELSEALLVLGDVGVDLAVGALEVRVGDDARSSMSGPDDVDHVEVPGDDDAVEVGVDQVESRCRAEMAHQPRLDVLGPERFSQQRVVEEVDLADRAVVGGPPVGVDGVEIVAPNTAPVSSSPRRSIDGAAPGAGRGVIGDPGGRCPPPAWPRRELAEPREPWHRHRCPTKAPPQQHDQTSSSKSSSVTHRHVTSGFANCAAIPSSRRRRSRSVLRKAALSVSAISELRSPSTERRTEQAPRRRPAQEQVLGSPGAWATRHPALSAHPAGRVRRRDPSP